MNSTAARLAAGYIGCEHTEIVLSGWDIAEAFDDLICAIDQPSHDGTNTYFVSRLASQSVRVVLSGLGGDEFFAGYPHFAWLQQAAERKTRWPDLVLSTLHTLRPNRFTRLAQVRRQKLEQRYASVRRNSSDAAIAAAVADPLLVNFRPSFLETYVTPFINETIDPVSQVSLVEQHHYLRNTLLRDADAMSMGNGLEVRPVLLDHALVEYALALSPSMKLRDGRGKAILVEAVRDLLPPELLSRPKAGFVLPQGSWLRTVLRDRLLDCLNSPRARQMFSPSFLAGEKINFEQGRGTKRLWTLLILISWADKYHCMLPV